jgi:glyoxylase-like metal-dependent hydrolase (beta-lactamase superfamily II)
VYPRARRASGKRDREMSTDAEEGAAMSLAYDVFVNDPPPQDGLLPNGEPKRFSPMASTLIYGTEDAVLTDPGMTEEQARVLGDWVAAKDRNVTDIFITHGHGDHFFAAGLLAERFGARVVPGDRFTLEGRDLVMVDVGHGDADDNSVLHVPDLGLVVAGDVIYNGVHMYLGQSATVGFGPWRDAIGAVVALDPRYIVTGHKNAGLDDDAKRTIGQTRQYLDDADELLRTADTALGYFNAKIERYPDYLGRLILWVTARALYGVREHPGEDVRSIILASWL